MKRKLTIAYDTSQVKPDFRILAGRGPLGTERLAIFEGEFSFGVEHLQRFVDVKLLDASGVSLNQKGMEWTYEDTQDEPLQVGDYVMVPFGWANGEYLAKVVKASTEPSYTGCAPIKQVAARMVAEF